MKLSSNLAKHLTLGAIFGAALLFGFGAQEANAQVYQDRYYDGYYDDDGRYRQGRRQDRSHRGQEKRDLKHHQRHEREYYGNSRAVRDHQRQEKRELKHHQRHERARERRRDYEYDRYYPYNY